MATRTLRWTEENGETNELLVSIGQPSVTNGAIDNHQSQPAEPEPAKADRNEQDQAQANKERN